MFSDKHTEGCLTGALPPDYIREKIVTGGAERRWRAVCVGQSPMERDALRKYLNDHLGGATAALQLLDHLADSAASTAEKGFFQGLHAEISEDLDILSGLIEKTGKPPSGLRQAGGWIAAKLGQLKLAADNPTAGTLDYFEALEVLSLGILGKRALWRALATIGHLPELQGLDIPRLEQRAVDQFDRVESRRLAAAREALTAGV